MTEQPPTEDLYELVMKQFHGRQLQDGRKLEVVFAWPALRPEVWSIEIRPTKGAVPRLPLAPDKPAKYEHRASCHGAAGELQCGGNC